MLRFPVLFVGAALLPLAVPSNGTASPSSGDPAAGRDHEPVLQTYGNLPLTFVENRGQMDARARFSAQGSRYAFHFTPEETLLTFVEGPGAPRDDVARGVVLALRFLGGNAGVAVEGEDRAAGEVNYFIGNDPARWHTGIPRYGRIVYRDLWPGVDMTVRGQDGELKYEFRLQPARIADIRMAYAGASRLTMDDAGGLAIESALGVLRDSAPVAYQEIDGQRVPVEIHYALADGADAARAFGFALGTDYRPELELVIDPSLAYSTLLGGASDEAPAGLAVDAAGNAYIVGVTQSADFPTTAGAFDRTLGGPSNPTDIFVTKLNPTGTGLVYSTYVGTGGFDWGRALAIDAAGNAYVTGQTAAQDFPTTGGAFDRTLNSSFFDQNDCIVFKLNASGSSLAYSTYLGGTSTDDGLAIAVDGAGSAYVAGQTTSTNFPTTAAAFDRTNAGSNDVFVTKFNATGSALVYSTLLGGADNELPADIVVDSTGNAFLGGGTRSFDYPTTPGAYNTTHSSAPFDELFDIFVTKLNPAGSALVFSTFVAGSKSDFGDGLAIDTAGSSYIVGGTLSPDFPTTPGTFDPVFSGTSEAFVVKLNAAGSALVYSTFLGEAGASSVAPDASGNAWLAGGTSSPTAFTTADGFDRTHNGGGDAYIAELNATGSALLYATFLGGANGEGCSDVALDAANNVYVVGKTLSANFQTTAGAFDRVFNGDTSIFWGDAFVAKLASGAFSAASLSAVSVSPTSVVGGNGATGTVTLTSAAPTGGLLVNLADNSSAATVPASVTVASGATTATFAVTTTSVATSTSVTITATQGANTRTATLTVTPVPPPASLSAVSVNPTSVTGGSNSTGTVTLTSAAPAGGLVVNLADNSAAATLPASVTVASGATTASFTVTTTTVASATSVTITATQGANTRTATLTVNPQPSGPLPAPSLVAPANDARFSPGQNITFDWSDVTGAASYTLQIDNNQTIAAPFVLEQTVTASTFSTSTLPTQTMWWRVRANDSAGNPGNWSSVRRFEVKN